MKRSASASTSGSERRVPRILFSLRKKKEKTAEEMLPLAEMAATAGEVIDAELSLCALRATADPARILPFLDTHLDDIEAQDCLATAREILSEIEMELDENSWSPGSIDMLASLPQRIHTGNQERSLRRSVELYGEALRRYEQVGEHEGAAIVRNNLGNALVELAAVEPDRYRQAIPLLEEAMEFYREVSNEAFRASIWMSLGDAYYGLEEEGADHYHLARDCFDRAWSLFERDAAGGRYELAAAQGRLGDVQLQLVVFDGGQSLEKAIRHYRNALAVFVELDDPDVCGTYHARLANAYVRLSEMHSEHLRKGIRAYRRALDMFTRSANVGAQAMVCLELARLYQITGDSSAPDLAAAVSFYMQGLQLYGDQSSSEYGVECCRGRADCLRGLAQVYLSSDVTSDPRDVSQALLCLEEAARSLAGLEGAADACRTVQEELQDARQLEMRLVTQPVSKAHSEV